jgi:hypothetical protein
MRNLILGEAAGVMHQVCAIAGRDTVASSRMSASAYVAQDSRVCSIELPQKALAVPC